ncbi:MAG: hypothetical protein QW568_01385 [Candidatus Anstonellaceae archaeon]
MAKNTPANNRCAVMRSQAESSASIGFLRGQAAAETLVLVGFALIFIVPLALLFLSTSGNELGKSSIAQAKSATRAIADYSGEVYLQGPGAKKSIVVNYPQGVLNGSVSEGLVVLTIDADGRKLDIVSPSIANLSGNLSGKRGAGLQKIDMVYNSANNTVEIRYG